MQSEPATFVDPGIPMLASVLDSSRLSNYLAPILPSEWGELHDVRSQVLQHHQRRRCTVNIALQTANGSYELIGKIYAEDGADVYNAMDEISRAGFGPHDEFSIPKPLAYLSELNLLLQEKVPGASATEIFINGGEQDCIATAERCARWLAKFHMRAPRLGPIYTITRDLMEYWVGRLVKRAGLGAGQLPEKAMLLLNRLESAGAELDETEKCSAHGGYCHQQIISNETRTVAFDWDHFCVADPSRDVGRFMFALQQLALQSLNSLKSLDASCQAFYDAYLATSRFELTNLAFYTAAHCLKHARYHLKQGRGGFEKTEAMLDEGLRILAEDR